MEVISPIHGKINYEEKDIIIFKKGIPGFETLKKYIIKELEDEIPFKILQSLENVELGFVIVSPFYVKDDYEIKLSDEIIDRLEIKSPEEVILYSIVTLNSKVENITVNMKAPLILNIKSKKGEQFIVDREEYKVKHRLK